MDNINNQVTAISPSPVGMPACGNAFTTTALRGIATTTVVRDRQATVTGDMGLAGAYFPGSRAWSPPTS